MARLDAVVQTFPPPYAKKWREYVNSIQTMLIAGRVSKKSAYDSVAALLGNGNDTPVASGTAPNTTSGTTNGSKDTSSQFVAAQQLSELASNPKGDSAALAVSTENTIQHTSDIPVQNDTGDTIANQGDKSCGSSTQAGSNAESLSAAFITSKPMDYSVYGTPFGPGYVESYMKQAKDAGPKYHKAAEEWLAQLRQWQSKWATPYAALNAMHNNSQSTKVESVAVSAPADKS